MSVNLNQQLFFAINRKMQMIIISFVKRPKTIQHGVFHLVDESLVKQVVDEILTRFFKYLIYLLMILYGSPPSWKFYRRRKVFASDFHGNAGLRLCQRLRPTQYDNFFFLRPVDSQRFQQTIISFFWVGRFRHPEYRSETLSLLTIFCLWAAERTHPCALA